MRPLAVRDMVAPGLDATEDVEACRFREAGAGGGPIEVRTPEVGRVFAVTDGTRALEGVPVRETEALEGPLNCLVGDFVGDLAMLDGRFLDTGLGLGALRLFLLFNPVSPEMDVRPAPGAKLDGRDGLLTGAALGGGA